MRPRKSPKRRLRRPATLIAYAAGALTAGILTMAWFAGLRVNGTASMPLGLWRMRTVDAPLRRGQIVTACLPNTGPIQEAAARGYIPAGTCSGGHEPLLKSVAAVAGDVVTVTPQGIVVDGQLIENTAQLVQDCAGRPLRPIPAGTYPVLPGQIWLLTGHDRRSFDSRYFGPVPAASVQGIARPVWVFG